MTQGLVAGCTNYREQTISDIRRDIGLWMKYTKEVQELFESTILQLSQSEYWDIQVPFNFKMFCLNVPKICATFDNDFDIILADIDKNKISERTIKLMRNIARVVAENEELSWRTYNEDMSWKEYDKEDFRQAEKLYQNGRDFFASLLDVSNAVARMEDYMTDEKNMIVNENINNSINNNVSIGSLDNSTHNNVTTSCVDNSVHIGDKNKIKSSTIGNDNTTNTNTTNTQPKERKLVWKIIIPILISVVSGVVATAISLWCGLSR